MKKEDLKIVFLGTPEFAVESLSRLVDGGYRVLAVVTMPDKPAGRGHRMLQSDVKKYALDKGLPVLQPRNLKDPEFLEQLRALDADLFIVIAFRMLPREVWEMPRIGTFNLHGSLLPKYRGAAPINRAIMNGETETGVTTFFLRHEIDTGDIIRQECISIGPDENVGSVHDRLMKLGAGMTLATVEDIIAGTMKTHPQPEGEFIPAPKIFKEDCEIKWNRTSQEIHNHVRGLSPYPAACTTVVEKSGRQLELKVFATRLCDEEFSGTAGLAPGTVIPHRKRLLTATGSGVIEILSVKPAGKKTMDASAFLLGYTPDRFIESQSC